ncbi:MAG: acyltransferase [Alsobacter sp.]
MTDYSFSSLFVTTRSSSGDTKGQTGRLVGLHGLRAVATLAVVANHSMDHMSWMGEWRMPFFFVLSGFLLGRILLKARVDTERRGVDRAGVLIAFYGRRSLRLLPPLFLTILVAKAFTWSSGESVLWHLLQSTNLYLAEQNDMVAGSLNHLWSLNVEEQFCLVLPLILLVTPIARIPVLIAGLWLASLASVLVLTHLDVLPVLAPSWLHSFATGLMLACLQKPSLWRWNWGRWGMGLLFAGMACVTLWRMAPSLAWPEIGKAVAIDGVIVMVIIAVANGVVPSVAALLEAQSLRSIGEMSYGVYLYHLPILGILTRVMLHVGHPLQHGLGAFLLTLALTLPAAALSWRFLEQPLLLFRNRLWPSPGATGSRAM